MGEMSPATRGRFQLPVPDADPLDAFPRVKPASLVAVRKQGLGSQEDQGLIVYLQTEITIAVRKIGSPVCRHVAAGHGDTEAFEGPDRRLCRLVQAREVTEMCQ